MTIDLIEKSKCNGCHACFNACPQKCIDMITDDEGFLYPVVNKTNCLDCGICVKKCPVLNKERTDNQPVAYAIQNNDEFIRMNSSSGGFFTILSEYILDKGGYVFGAAFDDNFKLQHVCINDKNDLAALRCSKYVQSEIGSTYQQAKKLLDANESVLFTGTPCQIAGLYKYLGKDYDNLLTHDIICHGVPSPMVWQKYVAYREKEAGSKIEEINFRNKNFGWKLFSMRIQFQNKTQSIQTVQQDLYLKAFLKNFCLRPSCYSCSFKDIIRQSDFTLADFWGIHKMFPDTDDKGTSLVFVNSLKAKDIFNSLSDRFTATKTDVEDSIKYNSAMIESVALPKERQKFMSLIKKKSFDYTIKKTVKKIPFYRRLIAKTKSIIKKLK